ncbi:hypothetical protein [Candidatus Accumulibacter aalborgensis]|nr:hypothetical protein [Candidatus Accumulibacter aalborgensis]
MRAETPGLAAAFSVFVMVACLSLPGAGLLVNWLTGQRSKATPSDNAAV